MRLSLITVIAVALGVCSCGANEAKKVHEYNESVLERYRPSVVQAIKHARDNGFKHKDLTKLNLDHLRVKEPELTLMEKIRGSDKIKEGEFELECLNEIFVHESLSPYIMVKMIEYGEGKQGMSISMAPEYLYQIILDTGFMRVVDYRAYMENGGRGDMNAFSKFLKIDK